MDKEMAFIFYRALMMICRYLEQRYGFGKYRNSPPPAGYDSEILPMGDRLDREIVVK